MVGSDEFNTTNDEVVPREGSIRWDIVGEFEEKTNDLLGGDDGDVQDGTEDKWIAGGITMNVVDASEQRFLNDGTRGRDTEEVETVEWPVAVSIDSGKVDLDGSRKNGGFEEEIGRAELNQGETAFTARKNGILNDGGKGASGRDFTIDGSRAEEEWADAEGELGELEGSGIGQLERRSASRDVGPETSSEGVTNVDPFVVASPSRDTTESQIMTSIQTSTDVERGVDGFHGADRFGSTWSAGGRSVAVGLPEADWGRENEGGRLSSEEDVVADSDEKVLGGFSNILEGVDVVDDDGGAIVLVELVGERGLETVGSVCGDIGRGTGIIQTVDDERLTSGAFTSESRTVGVAAVNLFTLRLDEQNNGPGTVGVVQDLVHRSKRIVHNTPVIVQGAGVHQITLDLLLTVLV